MPSYCIFRRVLGVIFRASDTRVHDQSIIRIRGPATPSADYQDRLDQAQAVMLSEVGKVLRVERRERKIIDQAARRDPCIVLRPWTAALLRPRLKLPPFHGDRL